VVVARSLEGGARVRPPLSRTEHLLLAGTAERGLANTALADLRVTERAVRESIARIIGRGRTGESATARDHAAHEARPPSGGQRGKAHRSAIAAPGPEHVLLALAASDAVARDILAERGVGKEAVRERLASLIEREAPEIAVMLRAPTRRGVRRRFARMNGEHVRDLIPFVRVSEVARSIAFYELLGFELRDTHEPRLDGGCPRERRREADARAHKRAD
jgi:hypothetical protein